MAVRRRCTCSSRGEREAGIYTSYTRLGRDVLLPMSGERAIWLDDPGVPAQALSSRVIHLGEDLVDGRHTVTVENTSGSRVWIRAAVEGRGNAADVAADRAGLVRSPEAGG